MTKWVNIIKGSLRVATRWLSVQGTAECIVDRDCLLVVVPLSGHQVAPRDTFFSLLKIKTLNNRRIFCKTPCTNCAFTRASVCVFMYVCMSINKEIRGVERSSHEVSWSSYKVGLRHDVTGSFAYLPAYIWLCAVARHIAATPELFEIWNANWSI